MSSAPGAGEVRLGGGRQVTLDVATGPSVAVSSTGTAPAVEFAVGGLTSTALTTSAPATDYTEHGVGDSGGIQLGAGTGTGGFGVVIGGSVRYEQATPAAQWSFVHPLGRTPQVTCYIAPDGATDGLLEQVDTYVVVNDTQVIVTWPFPVAGQLIVQ